MSFFSRLRSAKDLDELTVGDLEDMFYIKVQDPENITAEQKQRLKELVDERHRLAQCRAVNADELGEKLRNIAATSSRPSPPTRQTSSRSETPSIEQMVEMTKAGTYGDHNRLLQLGGRPSAPIQPDPGVWDPSRRDKELHVLGHWDEEGSRCYLDLCRWKKFIEYRRSVRKSPKSFLKYVDGVSRYRQRKGIEESLQPQLQRQLKRQTKLDKWKEYYIYEHCKLARLERGVKQTQLALESAQQRRLKAAGTENLREYTDDNLLIIAGRVGGAEIDVEQHEALLQWIKQQLLLIALESAASSHRNGNKEPASNLAPSDSKPHISGTSGRQSFNKQPKARSVLSPINSGKVSKATKRKERPRTSLSTRNDTDDRDQGLDKESQTISPQVSLRRSGRISQPTTNFQAPAVGILRRSERLWKKSEEPGLLIPVPGPKRADPITGLRSDPKRRSRDTANTRSPAKPQGVSKNRKKTRRR